MSRRRVNVFGQPLAFDIGVTYDGQIPIDRQRSIEEGDDVSQVTKTTVVGYINDLTSGREEPAHANEFPVVGSGITGREVEETSITTPSGGPAPLSGPSSKQFVSPNGEISNRLETASSARMDLASDSGETLDVDFLRKGRAPNLTDAIDGTTGAAKASGHNLLSSDPSGMPDRRVQERYVSPALSRNRFRSSSTLSADADRTKRYNPDHPVETLGSHAEFVRGRGGKDVREGDLANVGPMLGLRATKELNSTDSDGYGTDGPNGTSARASSLLPGTAQVAVSKVAIDDLTAESALRALIEGNADPAALQAGASNVISLNDSYGQMNNHLERFSGLLPAGTIAAAVAMSVALNVALRAALATFLLVTSASTATSIKRDQIGRYLPGNARFNPGFDGTSFPPIPLPAKLFGLQETVNSYDAAVEEGIKVFFGGNVGGTLGRVLEAPGFYATFCRSIVRSAADLARILENIGGQDVFVVADNIVGFVEALRSSKVVAVLNVFAQIGDASLVQRDRAKRFGDPNVLANTALARPNDSEIDNLEGLDAMRNRQRGSLALAWGASTTPSALMIPNTLSKAMLSMSPGALSGLAGESGALQFHEVSEGVNRISRENVDLIENALDVEYLPFYFHDLRTNEIASFHAFLSNLSEDYAANYDSIDGYGRVDAVKMYKSTSRRVSVTFMIAATNQDDFDAMWLKLNKLTSLLYPQWSEGTTLRPSSTQSFTQPFSQVPTASPIVRFRVGDLWTSNYSRFSLARIFGLGSKNFKLDDYVSPSSDNGKYIAQLGKMLTLSGNEIPKGARLLLEPGDYDVSTQDKGILGAVGGAIASVANVVGVNLQSPARVTARIRVPTRVRVEKDLKDGALAVSIIDGEGLPESVVTSQLLVSRSHLTVTQDTAKSLGISEGTTGNGALRVSPLGAFFSEKNNAIFRSFDAARGKGLACTVDSMSLDWNNVPWETGVEGSRAPKICRVTMGMSIIHDIAPGIDAYGANRAPIYSVGRQSNALAGKEIDNVDSSFQRNARKIRKSLI